MQRTGEDAAELGRSGLERCQRVVAVCDDDGVVALLEALLEVDGRFTVVGVAGTALEGAALLEAHAPDVLVLDLDLAGHGGLEALAALRAHLHGPIVVFGAFPDPLTLVEVLRLGGDAYLDTARLWSELLPTLTTVCDAVLTG